MTIWCSHLSNNFPPRGNKSHKAREKAPCCRDKKKKNNLN